MDRPTPVAAADAIAHDCGGKLKEVTMPNPAVIGLDIAKNVFQVHGADAEGDAYCAGSCGEPRSSCSLPDCRKRWSASRHVRAGIIGRANFAALAMTSG